MDLSDSEAKRILVAIGEITAVLRNRCVELRCLPEVKNADSAVEIMSGQSGPVLESYLDLELHGEDGLSWIFDAWLTEDPWTIDASLNRQAREEQVIRRKCHKSR
jgi:hypothetical protein